MAVTLSQFINSGSPRVKTLTGSGTVTVPGGVYVLYVSMVAAGGSGAAANHTGIAVVAATGGGSGEAFIRYPLEVSPGDEINYSIGTGGATVALIGNVTASSNGYDGGDTTFGSLTAAGGSGGNGATANSAASSDDDLLETNRLIYDGFARYAANPSDAVVSGAQVITGWSYGRYKHGAYSTVNNYTDASGGAPSPFGSGGNAATGYEEAATASAGTGYGSGGGGAAVANSSAEDIATSGAGADGTIILEWTGLDLIVDED
jgi:hypothetical protein